MLKWQKMDVLVVALPTTTPNMADMDIELTLEDLEASEDMKMKTIQ